jgi:hypothetical protein
MKGFGNGITFGITPTRTDLTFGLFNQSLDASVGDAFTTRRQERDTIADNGVRFGGLLPFYRGLGI